MMALKWWQERVSKWFAQGRFNVGVAGRVRPRRTLRFEPLERRRLLSIVEIQWSVYDEEQGWGWLGVYWDSGATKVEVSASASGYVVVSDGTTSWELDGTPHGFPVVGDPEAFVSKTTDAEIQWHDNPELYPDAGDGNDTIDLTAMTPDDFSNFTYAVIYGGGGADSIKGCFESDSVRGEGGTDTIYGYGGGDTLYGNDGYDLLYGGDGADMAFGGDNGDTIEAGAGDDCVDGGSGGDQLVFSGGSDLGTDSISDSGGSHDLLDFTGFGAGITVDIDGSPATQTVASGKLVLIFGGSEVFEHVDGSAYADSITGNTNANRITGGGGADTISGSSGNDSLYGNGGDDSMDGDSGNDTLDGGSGTDTVNGGAGDDLVYVNDGSAYDNASGGDDNDTVYYDSGDYVADFETMYED